MRVSSKLTGGSFLLKNTPASEVFIPEEFTEEQKMIHTTVTEFMLKEVPPVWACTRSRLRCQKDKDLVLEIFHKAAELGLCGVSIDEKFGGLGLGFNTGLLFTEGLAGGFSCYYHWLSNVYRFTTHCLVWYRRAESKIPARYCQW